MREFLWTPGQGMDPAALARLADHFQCPREPMGEAWFMSQDRTMYPQLMGDVSRLPRDDIERALVEIASGYSAFGPMREWSEWYHYLLARVLPRAHDASVMGSLLENVITAHIAVYPNGGRIAPYKKFHEDALLTIGRCMMEPGCWNGGAIAIGEVLHRSNRNPAGVWGWWDASGDFSASMMFCLKYLPAELVPGWLKSALDIPSAHWRAQIMAWAVGIHDMLQGEVKWPAEWNINARPDVSWEWSHCLRGEVAARAEEPQPHMMRVLPDSARQATLDLLRSHFTADVFLEWLESISGVDYLMTELFDLPSKFELLYVEKPPSRLIVPA